MKCLLHTMYELNVLCRQ